MVNVASIVVDKSFLQGAPARRISDLASEHRLLMSDALFYELLTTTPQSRCQCFSKLPAVPNPVDLVSHVGALMRKELDTQRPSGPPSFHREDLNFLFNSQLTAEHYRPPADAQQAIDEETARLKWSVDAFIERSEHIPSFFPDLLNGSQSEREDARLEAESTIASPRALLSFLGQLEPPPGESALPSADRINENWAIYRWLQVQLLFSLDLYVRYQGNVATQLTINVLEKVEHDVLDAELLALGCLEGSYATMEKKHKRWWRLLCPNGTLYE